MCIVPVIVIRYLCIVICYLFICARYFIVIIHLFCSLFNFSFAQLFYFCSTLILLLSFFIVHCSKKKDSILTLDCVPGISILHTTSSMRVNKHHKADSIDFVLV